MHNYLLFNRMIFIIFRAYILYNDINNIYKLNLKQTNKYPSLKKLMAVNCIYVLSEANIDNCHDVNALLRDRRSVPTFCLH